MSRRRAEIVLDVDVRNPGQFFACCGVLEIASRLWADTDVEGWFDRTEFCVTVPGVVEPLQALVTKLVATTPLVRLCPDARRFEPNVAPVWFEPIGLRLDWWLAPSGAATFDQVLKLWAGNQGPAKTIFPALEKALRRVSGSNGVPVVRNILRRRTPMSGRLGIDPGPAWEALDVGFSPNEQRIDVETAPFTEVLGAVGLQRFRPARRAPGGRLLEYAVWSEPLPLLAAHAAASGVLPARRYRFTVNSRGNYKGFGYASEIKEMER